MDAAIGFDQLRERLLGALRSLPDKPEETPEVTFRALCFAAAGIPVSAVRAQTEPMPDLSEDMMDRLRSLVDQRIAGTPLAHLTGWQRFMDLEFRVGPQAMIPRKETEILGHAVLGVLRELSEALGQTVVADICTGSGNLALSVAHHQPSCRVVASDISEEAVQLARQNAEHHGLGDRVEFRVGDLCEPLASDFKAGVDLLMCNPPYISSGKVPDMPAEIAGYEPTEAFDGGPYGVSIMTRLLKSAPGLLKPGAWLCFEVGLNQGPGMMRRLQRTGAFDEIQTREDANGDVRVIVARRQ